MPILVGVIEDHPTMQLGLVALLNGHRGIRVVESGAAAADLTHGSSRLDVILLELALSDGSHPAQNLRTVEHRGAPVVAYTSGDSLPQIREAAAAGAAGMIRSSAPVDEIVESVRRAARGHTIETPEWVAALTSVPPTVSAHLTMREAEVFALYVSGATAEQVAKKLYLSRETVLDHIRRIRAKYNAADRAAPTKIDLFHRAVEDGIVVPA